MPYPQPSGAPDQRPNPTTSDGSQNSTNGTGGGGGTGMTPGGLAESVAYDGSQKGGATRDEAAGSPEQAQQQQSMQMMDELKGQYQTIIQSLTQVQEQVKQLEASFPAAQESLQSVDQAFMMIGQALVQSMMTVIQQVQAEPAMPPQV